MLLFVPYCVAHEKSRDLTSTGGGNMQNLGMLVEARRAMLIPYILGLSTTIVYSENNSAKIKKDITFRQYCRNFYLCTMSITRHVLNSHDGHIILGQEEMLRSCDLCHSSQVS